MCSLGDTEDEEDRNDALDMSWPNSARKRITYVLVAPILIPLWMTLPDTKSPKGITCKNFQSKFPNGDQLSGKVIATNYVVCVGKPSGRCPGTTTRRYTASITGRGKSSKQRGKTPCPVRVIAVVSKRKLFCSSSTYLQLVRSARDLRHGRANKISKSTISNQCSCPFDSACAVELAAIRQFRKKFFVITFVGSICWIAAYSYLMVWWANVAGETAGIPPEILSSGTPHNTTSPPTLHRGGHTSPSTLDTSLAFSGLSEMVVPNHSRQKPTDTDMTYSSIEASGMEADTDGQETFTMAEKFGQKRKHRGHKIDDDQSKTTTNTTPKTRYPPIVTLGTQNYNHITKIAKEKINYIRINNISNIQKIHTTKKQDYDLTQHLLKDFKQELYTYTLPKDKSVKLVIKGLPHNIATDDLEQELKEMGFPVTDVRLFTRKSTADNTTQTVTLIPTFQVTLEKSSDTSTIYQIKSIDHTRNNAQCVKCLRQHITKDCPKKDTTTLARCVNCMGSHTANYTKFPVYVQLLEAQKNKLNK
uniref:Pre-C2HC domain-containing protein n=1 Tax=Timema douglasi TaxID=61478 RepID=A0A7R8ZBQ6_TIMDO|nr:unnamed protein product [Timema douglasi]